MQIKEYITHYLVTIDREDLVAIGTTIEQIIYNLKEASGLVGKPLGKYYCTYDQIKQQWLVTLEKQLENKICLLEE